MLAERLRRAAEEIWNRIFNHPFVIEIYSGNLPFKKFTYYILQDYAYLVGITRAFSIIASKADFEIAREILKIAEMEATTEMDNYENLLNEMGLGVEDAINTDISPTNMAYINFILSTSFMGNAFEGIASILPCFWSYMEIWEKNSYLLEGNKNELYKKWAMEYGSDGYIKLVKKLIDMMNKAEEKDYEKLRDIFLKASRYEYAFWEMAYKMERWEI